MIYLALSIVFAVIAALSVAGVVMKKTERGTYFWILFSAAITAAAAYYHVFWPVPVFGLMTLWASFTALSVMNPEWRLKVGLSMAIALGAALAIYPSGHDEIGCSEPAKGEEYGVTCPQRLDKLAPEDKADEEAKSKAGDRGIKRFILANIPFRMVRGLDLSGGQRLVYTVDVEEAIKDQRDRTYDALRSQLATDYKLATGDAKPTVEQMQQLSKHMEMSKPRDVVDTIILRFNSADDAKKHVNDKFLVPFLRELTILRDSDGKTITFKIRSDIGTNTRERAVTQARDTIRRRVDSMGVKEAAVSVRDQDIIVEIAGKNERAFQEIRDIISQTARLEFKLLGDEVDYFKTYITLDKASLPKGLEFQQENAPLGQGRSQPNYYAYLARLPGQSMEEALKVMKAWVETLEVPEDFEVGFGKEYRVNPETEEYEPSGWRTYYLRSNAVLTGDQVRDAQAQANQSDASTGGWFVTMTLTPRGGEIFGDVTEANVKRRFAIILDGVVESAPVINERIGGGQARISMGAGGIQQQLKDARKLELVLRSGALPAPISPTNEQRIGASLGDDAIGQGVIGASIGAIAVLALMLVSYRKAGMIANIAVLFNLMLQIAVLAMFSASMTLPGIAGLALTIGVAVDANVLINERIKEELASGKTARSAVAIGYEKAFSAIMDGNATTLIAALILAQYGTGPIKGFAVTLTIGMLTNIFTGVIVTRLFFEFWVRGRKNVDLGMPS